MKDEFFEQLLSSVKETDVLIQECKRTNKEVGESEEKEETSDAKTD